MGFNSGFKGLMVLQKIHARFDSCLHCTQSVLLLANYPRPHAVDRTSSDELAKIRKEGSMPNPRHYTDIFPPTLKKATKRLRQVSWPRCEMGPPENKSRVLPPHQPARNCKHVIVWGAADLHDVSGIGSTHVSREVGNITMTCLGTFCFKLNPLNPELNPICYLLELLGAHRFLHVSRIRVKLLTFRLLMS